MLKSPNPQESKDYRIESVENEGSGRFKSWMKSLWRPILTVVVAEEERQKSVLPSRLKHKEEPGNLSPRCRPGARTETGSDELVAKRPRSQAFSALAGCLRGDTRGKFLVLPGAEFPKSGQQSHVLRSGPGAVLGFEKRRSGPLMATTGGRWSRPRRSCQ